MTKIAQMAPMGRAYRVSSENSFPLRNSEGLTFAEVKRRKEQEQGK
jgi:hypothetical protein